MADYPREIYLDEEVEEALRQYIDSELLNHYAERAGHLDDLTQWQKDYWAEPTTKVATFPFEGAATLVIPLDAIAVESIHANAMTRLFALGSSDFVTAEAIDPAWDAVTNPMERFMNRELLVNMKIRKPINDCFLENTKFGTMIGKTSYVKEVKRAVREIAGERQDFEVVVRDGATVDYIADARFLMPYYAKDPQSAPWVGEEHTETVYQAMMLEAAGMFRPGTVIDEEGWETDDSKKSKLHAWLRPGLSSEAGQEGGAEFDRNQQKLENTQPVELRTIDWVELWMAFHTVKGRMPAEIVVHYHRPTRTFMSIRYNWNGDLRRPYRTGNFFPVEGRWRGIGICKMNEQFQREITVQHRQRIDNATLANARMIVISKNSDYGPSEPIFPGKMWFLDDVTQINTIQMGEVYQSSYANEQAAQIYSQQRSGVNDLALGMPQAGTPGTATSDLARIQEGQRKSDFIYNNKKEFVNELIIDTASVIQQFGPRRLAYYERGEKGNLIRDFFSMPNDLVRDGLIISLKAAGQQQNKIIDRQNWQQITQYVTLYYKSLIELGMMTGDQNLVMLFTQRAFASATETLTQVLETFDIRNIDKIVVKELLDQARTNAGLVAPGANGARSAQSQGTQQASGMDLLAQVVQTTGGRGERLPPRIEGRENGSRTERKTTPSAAF